MSTYDPTRPPPQQEPERTQVPVTAPLVTAFLAALIFAYAGWQLVSIQTLAEEFQSVDELFANGVGIMCFGLAALSVSFGLRR
jgi:uncharacterized membrane protein (UPF0182 family)